MLNRFSLFLFFLFCFAGLYAQNTSVFLHGHVTDINGKAIPYCGIQNLGFHSGTSTDSNGVYSFNTTIPSIIRASALGYKPQQYKIAAVKDSIELNFILEDATLQLAEVSIHSKYEPELLLEEPTLADFELKEGKIWLLYNFKRRDRLAVTDTSGKLIVQSWMYNKASDLHKTEHDFVYSTSSDSAYVYQFDRKNHFSSFSVDIDTFTRSVLSIAAYHEPCYYYMTDTAARTLITYYFVNTLNDSTGVLWSNFNAGFFRDNMELYATIDALASSRAGVSGSAAAVNDALNSNMLAANHTRNDVALIKSSYCPMRVVRDSIYIFNFDIDTAYVFDSQNRLVRKMNMQFDLYGRKYMQKKMVVDEEKQHCYFEYSIRGVTHIDRINLDDGTRENPQVIDRFPFLEKLRVSDGYAYFCVFDSGTGKRMLVKQRLD